MKNIVKSNKQCIYEIIANDITFDGGHMVYDIDNGDKYSPGMKYVHPIGSFIFTDKNEMLEWILKNHASKRIDDDQCIAKRVLDIYQVEYVGEYQGLTDVIKRTLVEGNGAFEVYYTAISEKVCLKLCNPNKTEIANRWQDFNSHDLKAVYSGLEQIGITIKNNVYTNKTRREEWYDIIEQYNNEIQKLIDFYQGNTSMPRRYRINRISILRRKLKKHN